MKLSNPQQSYVNLWESISGDKVSFNKATQSLENYFQSPDKKKDFWYSTFILKKMKIITHQFFIKKGNITV